MRGMFIAIASSFAAFGSLVQAAEPGPKREALEVKSELVAGRGEVHAVEASIDGRRVLVAIDSGSSGLRILRRPLTRATAAAAAQSEFTFAVGTRLVGDIGRVHLNLGALSGDLSALNVHAIGCTRQVPFCPAERISPDAFGLLGYGQPGKGYEALLGINMASDLGPSPLIAIGAHAWIISLTSEPGRTGQLIINPGANEREGFEVMGLRPEFANVAGDLHDAVDGCLKNDASGAIVCGLVLFDTGSLGVSLQGALPAGVQWPASAWRLMLGNKSTPESWTSSSANLSIPVGLGRVTGRAGPIIIVVGSISGHDYELLYDPEHGVVGFRCAAARDRIC